MGDTHSVFGFPRTVSVYGNNIYLSLGKIISIILLETPMKAYLLTLPVASLLIIFCLLDALIFLEL